MKKKNRAEELQRVENSFRDILSAFDNPTREGLIDTPKRMAKLYEELIGEREFPRLTFFSSNGYDQMIVDEGIPYHSLCEHHVLPFFGKVTIGYIPDKKIIGLSKLARIVEYYSRRLNTQEYFTQAIADLLQKELNPIGLGVIVSGTHLCKEMRGAKSRGIMITSALKGRFLENNLVREEFLSLRSGLKK